MLSQFDWIEISGGRGMLKTSEADIMLQIPNEPYRIAKYPVTNAQFAQFMKADGYCSKNWWTQQGWQQQKKNGWEEPRYWQDSKWNSSQQPVVGVSWYEAVAFCHWLSEVTGKTMRLPTESQWQYAAQSDDGRAYPWGNDWDCARCNNSVKPCSSNITTPITRYADSGSSPFDVVDMIGNVWEWCQTDYDTHTNDMHNKDTTFRVLRGGSWLDTDVSWLRCDIRGKLYPHDRSTIAGFRICFVE
ncbi:MAG: SUMF1/EgtB/PvdO family nonheme iron enzyme [Chloroflexota bacterium]